MTSWRSCCSMPSAIPRSANSSKAKSACPREVPMSDPQKAAIGQTTTETSELGLLDQIVEQGRMGKDATAKERGKDLVKEFVTQVLDGSMTVSKDAESMINARIAQIDHLLSIQLNQILHHPSFQKLEGTWRGLKYLMDGTETSVMCKIKI